jgi:ABC-2 type transport system permease protein
MRLYKAMAFIKRDYIVLVSYKMALITTTVGAIFPLLSYFFISRLMPATAIKSIEVYGNDYFSFSLVGIAFTTYFTMAMGEFSALMRRDQMAGCFEALLSSQTDIKSLIFMSAIFKFLHNGTVLLFMFLFASLFLGFNFHNINFASTLLVVFLSLILFISLGIFSAAGTILFKQGEPFGFVFGTLGSLLGGAVFPVAVLPSWLKSVAQIVPITHSLDALRLAILKGYAVDRLIPQLLTLAAMSMLLFPLSLKFFEWSVEKGKKNGTLGQY